MWGHAASRDARRSPSGGRGGGLDRADESSDEVRVVLLLFLRLRRELEGNPWHIQVDSRLAVLAIGWPVVRERQVHSEARNSFIEEDVCKYGTMRRWGFEIIAMATA
jgi:hypothetical protein